MEWRSSHSEDFEYSGHRAKGDAVGRQCLQCPDEKGASWLGNAKIELWMTDLPERGVSHFFGPIKALSHLARKNLILVTPKPRGDDPLQFILNETHLAAEQVLCWKMKSYPWHPFIRVKRSNREVQGKNVKLKLSLNTKQKH